MKQEIKHYIFGIKNDVSYYNKKIIRLNKELEYINSEMTGISAISYDGPIVENKKPSNNYRLLELIEKESKVISQVEQCTKEIMKYEEVFTKLSPDVQQYIIELYIFPNSNHENVAKKYGYTRQSLYKKVNKEIERVTM